MSASVPCEGGHKLPRLFSSYPDRRLGIGLLFLRVAVAVAALVQGFLYFDRNGQGTVVGDTVGTALILLGVALVLGFLTPLASTLVGILVAGTGALWIPVPPGSLFDRTIHTALAVVVTTSVTILGPGAYSLDSRLFGRREVIIPRLPPRS